MMQAVLDHQRRFLLHDEVLSYCESKDSYADPYAIGLLYNWDEQRFLARLEAWLTKPDDAIRERLWEAYRVLPNPLRAQFGERILAAGLKAVDPGLRTHFMRRFPSAIECSHWESLIASAEGSPPGCDSRERILAALILAEEPETLRGKQIKTSELFPLPERWRPSSDLKPLSATQEAVIERILKQARTVRTSSGR